MKNKFLISVVLSFAILAFAVNCCLAAGSIDTKEAAHLARLNESRQASGLSQLKLSTELTAAAKIRAKEITSRFSHTRPDGTKAYTAITDQSGWNGLSENIASGKGLDTAYNAVDVLMSSPGHRANILNADNVCVGVATYQDTNGEYFWVELFAQVRPSRDADKTPEGSTAEQTYITSVNDPSLTVDGAGIPNSTVGTYDYYANTTRASVADLIRESQKRDRYTLFVLWNTVCGNVNITQLQAEAHARKERVSQGAHTADSDATLPRIFELGNVNIILVNYLGTYGDMKGAMDSYWPGFGASNTVWRDAMCLRTTTADETLAKGYGKFFDIDGNPSEVLFFLYGGGKMIAKSRGLSQSNTFDQWAKKIAALASAKTPDIDKGENGDEKDDETFTPPTTADALRSAIGADAAKKLITGANIVTFVDGKHDALTNANTAPTARFKKSQHVHHTLYMMDGSGAIGETRDGEKIRADVMRGDHKIMTKELTITDGHADLALNVNDILAAENDDASRARALASGSSDRYSLRIYNEAGDIDLTTNFTIDTSDAPQPNSSGGGCSTGAAAIAIAALALTRRRTK